MRNYDRIATFMLANWLGHGRAVECYLAVVAALYGALLLCVPGAAFDSKATYEIASWGYGKYFAIPFLTKAILTSIGLILNILGKQVSRPLRFWGAFTGTFIWAFLAGEFLFVGAVTTVGFPFCVGAMMFSIRIMVLSLADLPRPGAPGAA